MTISVIRHRRRYRNFHQQILRHQTAQRISDQRQNRYAVAPWRLHTIVGFGGTGSSADKQGIKRGTMVGRASASCSGHVPSLVPPRSDAAAYGCRPGREIVAGAMPNSSLSPDTCPGDSGGPLYVSSSLPAVGDPPEAEMRLAGVTSRSTARQQQQCGDGGIYVRLTGETRAWLEAELARPQP